MNKHQKEVDEFFKRQQWPYWDPMTQIVRLAEETGELARIVNHIYGPKQKRSDEPDQDLTEEIGDIILTLACLANPLGIDLDEAFSKSLKKVMERDKDRF